MTFEQEMRHQIDPQAKSSISMSGLRSLQCRARSDEPKRLWRRIRVARGGKSLLNPVAASSPRLVGWFTIAVSATLFPDAKGAARQPLDGRHTVRLTAAIGLELGRRPQENSKARQ